MGHLHRYMLLYNEVKPILCYFHFFSLTAGTAKIKPKIFLLQNRKIDSSSELIIPPLGGNLAFSKAKLKCMCAHKHTKFSIFNRLILDMLYSLFHFDISS